MVALTGTRGRVLTLTTHGAGREFARIYAVFPRKNGSFAPATRETGTGLRKTGTVSILVGWTEQKPLQKAGFSDSIGR